MSGPANLRELDVEMETHGSIAAVARAHGIAASTLKSRRERWQRETSAVEAEADVKTLEVKPGCPWQPEQLLRDHGLDPAEWIVTNARPNSWNALAPEGEVVTLHQLKVEAKRIIPRDMWVPARTDAPLRNPPRARRATKTRPLLIALAADQHCPHQDPGLEACWLEWCRTNKPDKIIGMGDVINLSKPSRHRQNLHSRHNDTPKECFQAGNDWWRNTLDAAGPKCEAEQVAGNHDLRAQIGCLERLPELYDVCRPGEEHPWWDLEYLLGLDKLGVKYHRPEGEYHDIEVQVAPGFSVAHGAKSGPYGGAPKDAARHEGSRGTAHAHKASLTCVVRYRDGEAHTHRNLSVPTMARLDMGYHPDPDTHQGFATLVVHECGYWNVELAYYDQRRKRLVWRDQMYHAAQ